jgi:hypothetical protein
MTAYRAVLLKDCSIWLYFFNINAPINANSKCDKALSTITGAKPATKKPSVDIIATKVATTGDINIAINIGTWLANVYDAGSTTILGKVIGINIPSAQRSADIVIIFTLLFLFELSILFTILC